MVLCKSYASLGGQALGSRQCPAAPRARAAPSSPPAVRRPRRAARRPRGARPAASPAPSPRRRSAPGEILVRGDASPASHGPYAVDGRYIVRFEQIAPEDPKLDFTGQTAFVAVLDRHAQQADPGTCCSAPPAGPAADAHAARAALRRREFGDFPYAIRLTPADAPPAAARVTLRREPWTT